MDLIVTTVQKTTPSVVETAKNIANLLQVPFVERGRYSLPAIKKLHNVTTVIVAAANGPTVYTSTGEYFFHLSMAELRIKNLINGKHDHMAAAMGLLPGMSVLDCTLGLATDAIVASYVTGENGLVVGLESIPVLALITRIGLQNFMPDSVPESDITSALRRIKVENSDYSQYLETLADNSFDVVYFDPMFRNPNYKSSNLNPIRSLADKRALTTEAIKQASRVAKQRIVVKEAAGSTEFSRLGITTVVGGKYSSINYGIIDCAQKKVAGGQLWNV